MKYHVEHAHRNVAIVHAPLKVGQEIRFLITADRHWDNPMSDWFLQRKHLNMAKKYGAGVIDIGDFFCAMQGKYDPRSSKSSLRPEHQVCHYLDALVETAANFFESWSKQFIVIAMGNHEAGILKKHETNLVSRLCRELNNRTGSNVYNGGYSGWINFVFKTGDEVECKKLWYIHGYGGGGPVTRGVIQSNRKAVYLPDAHIVVTGHVHEDWQVNIPRLRCTDSGKIHHDKQLHVQIPTYKDEYKDGYGGWHVETGKPPKPIGAAWLIFKKTAAKAPVSYKVERID